MDLDYTKTKKQFLTLIRKLKRKYWKKIINEAIDSTTLYKIIN